MAILRIPDENRSLQEHDEIRDFLTGIGIDYERWEPVAASAQCIFRPDSECLRKTD